MGKKSRENRERRERFASRAQPTNYNPASIKSGLSNAKKIFIGLILIAVIVISASVAFSQQPQITQGNSYPTNVSPVIYASASVSAGNNKVSVPLSNVNSSKLVFVDLKLTSPLETLEYQGRTVPLAIYKGGEYLPLVVISTPSGNNVAGIRTCEPCGSFSFHIVKGANLKCDVCGAEWTLEDFSPVSGGCATYPPPKLPTVINDDKVEIDLSALNLQFLI
jgi:hypothetical protein